MSRLSMTEVSEVVEDTMAALERAGSFHPLNPDEELTQRRAVGWLWDHQIAEQVEQQLRKRDRMAVVLYALSTRGRRDRRGREGWSDAHQVLAWLADRYPTLPEMPTVAVAGLQGQVWRHPGAAAPLPRRVLKRSRTEKPRGRERPFDYDQFKRSIRLAIVGRFPEPERDRQVDLIAEWVMWGFVGQDVILTSQLASAVLDCLRRVDDVAYLRWASLVKAIESVSEFAHEARGLVLYPSPPLHLEGAIRVGREAGDRAAAALAEVAE
ncbi:hypothetical protein [Microbacterium oxydans]|nr:hypothetical protein [Microbacterium oxydans]